MGFPRSNWVIWAVVFCFLCMAAARAALYVRGSGGNFSAPLWTNVSASPTPIPNSGPPGPNDTADMTGGSSATITASGGSVNTIEGTSNFNVTGAFSATTFNYSGVLMGTGILTVVTVTGSAPFSLSIMGGNLVAGTMAEDFDVDGGSLTVTTFSGQIASVSDGGQVTLDNAQNELNFDVESGGTLTMPSLTDTNAESTSVSGTGSMVTFAQDLNELGCALQVDSGAQLTAYGDILIAGALGVGGGATFTDPGTTVTVTGLFAVGDISAGSAVGVLNGAFVNTGTAEIGYGDDATGYVQISGSGTIWQSNAFVVGADSNGTLEMDTGALLTFSGAGDAGSAFGVGLEENATGTVTADGTGTVIDARNAFVSFGRMAGTTGNVMLTDSARILIGMDTKVGDSGSGNLTLHSGSQLTTTGNPEASFIIANQAGSLGELSLNDPGTLATITILTSIGQRAGANGALDVSGSATAVLSQRGLIGELGTGLLYMDTGGQAIIGGGTNDDFVSAWYLGGGPSGNGTVQVIGPGTSFTAVPGSVLFIGDYGKGYFTASAGAVIQTDTFLVGNSKGGSGTVVIDSGASWTTGAGSVVYLGLNGAATLALSNTATLLIPDKLVSGAKTIFTVDKTSQVAIGTGGFGPPGTVRVSAGGEFFSRGRVQAQVIVASPGQFYAGGDPGSLTIDGNLTLEPGSETYVELGGPTPGKNSGELIVTGTTVLGGTLNVTLADGFDPKATQGFKIVTGPNVSGSFEAVTGATVTYGANEITIKPVITPGTLTVSVSPVGDGTVTPAFSGTSTRNIGFTYAVTAKPASGFVFDGWSGSVTSDVPILVFAMAPGMTLQANFVPNAFAPAVGAYVGLALSGSEAGVPPPHAGLLNFDLGSSGKFTGKFLLGGATYPFKGTMLGNGTISNTVTIGGHTLAIQLTAALSGSDAITGTITFDGEDYAVNAGIAAFSKSNPASSYAGVYTIAFPQNTGNSNPGSPGPQGNCSATAAIAADGAVSIAGALADGTPLSAKGFLQANGVFPLFASLYKGQGIFAGELQFAPAPRNPAPSVSDVAGSVEWSQAGNVSLIFPNAFDTTLSATGSFYTPPAHGALPFPGLDADGDAVLAFTGGGLPPDFSPKPIVITTKDTGQYSPGYVPSSPADKLMMTFKPATGAFGGKFYNGTALTPFGGVVLQKQDEGEGFFIGTAGGGEVELTP